jgi:hypothetical protein
MPDQRVDVDIHAGCQQRWLSERDAREKAERMLFLEAESYRQNLEEAEQKCDRHLAASEERLAFWRMWALAWIVVDCVAAIANLLGTRAQIWELWGFLACVAAIANLLMLRRR